MCAVAIACAALASAGTSSASPYVVADATPAPPYVVASLPEPPVNVALSDSGVIAASLYDARAVALIDPDGVIRVVDISCSPRGVAIDPAGKTAWGVCPETPDISIVDVATGAVARVGVDAMGLDDIAYLPRVDRLLVASIDGTGGQVITLSQVTSNQYLITNRVVSDTWGFTELSPFPDGDRTYVLTDTGVLLDVDIAMGGQITVVRPLTAGRDVASIALSPTGTALYAVARDYADGSNVRTSIDRIDPVNGSSLQRVPLDFSIPQATKIDIRANHRSVYISSGIAIRVGDSSSGLVQMPTDKHGRLGVPRSVGQANVIGTAIAVSNRGGRVAWGVIETVSSSNGAIGMDVDGRAYPKEVEIKARVKAGKLTVTGTTVSLRPLTLVAVYVKDLTKAKARFVKQSRSAFVSSIGTLAWNGKAPSKRFAVYVSSRGTKSNTVTVTARP